jgi:hypothetical protein
MAFPCSTSGDPRLPAFCAYKAHSIDGSTVIGNKITWNMNEVLCNSITLHLMFQNTTLQRAFSTGTVYRKFESRGQRNRATSLVPL